MRLTSFEKNSIIETIREFDPIAPVYLFGSRVKDEGKGGDIDLLVLSGKIEYGDRIKIRARLMEKIGEQKIDLLVAPDDKKPFVRLALGTGVRL